MYDLEAWSVVHYTCITRVKTYSTSFSDFQSEFDSGQKQAYITQCIHAVAAVFTLAVTMH